METTMATTAMETVETTPATKPTETMATTAVETEIMATTTTKDYTTTTEATLPYVESYQGLTGADAADFEIYLLQMVWSNFFCCQHPHYCVRSLHNHSFVLHGLWPEYNPPRDTDKLWPQYCAANNTNNQEVLDFSECTTCTDDGACSDNLDAAPHCRLDRQGLGPDLVDSLARRAPGYLHQSMGDHEWIKHGSCTGASSDTYLREAVRVMDRVLLEFAIGPGQVQERLSVTWQSATLPSPLVNVDDDGHISYVTTCWQRDARTGLVGAQIKCPAATVQNIQPVTFNQENFHVPAHGPAQCFERSNSNPNASDSSNVAMILALVIIAGALLLWVVQRLSCNWCAFRCHHRALEVDEDGDDDMYHYDTPENELELAPQ